MTQLIEGAAREESTTMNNLAVNLTDQSLRHLNEQRDQLKKFISGSLVVDSDYGIIPGVKSPSLYKPGAEKLCKIFQLGSRIVKSEKDIQLDKNFAMFTYTVEVFHLPTGKAIAQCEASCNSQEKKYREKAGYVDGKKAGVEPQLASDLLNTLQKMAQKRAYVGATIIATGASDFFTQDVEDMDLDHRPQPKGAGVPCELCGTELKMSKAGTGFYCPNFKDTSKGEHTRFPVAKLEAYKIHIDSLKFDSAPAPDVMDPNWDDHKL